MMLSAIAFLLFATGVAAAAPADCWQMRKHGHEAEAKRCFNQLTQSQEEAVRAEGFWGLEEVGQRQRAVPISNPICG